MTRHKELICDTASMKLSISDTQHKMLCNYADCRILFFVLLNVIMLSVTMLNVIMLSAMAPKL
jgi:hypothetical protein